MSGSRRVAFWWVIFAALVALVMGAVGAWWIASWRGCQEAKGCEVSWSAVEAIGTWVGGAGTVAALIFAARQFALDQDERAAQMGQRQRDEQDAFVRAFQDAQLVMVSVNTPWTSGDRIREVQISVHNRANEESAFKLKVRSSEGDSREFHEVGPGAAQLLLKRDINIPAATGGNWRAAVLDSVELSFEMHGYRWTRKGENPARRA